MDEELKSTSPESEAPSKPEAPKLRSIRYEFAMGELPSDGIHGLYIRQSDLLERAMLEINALSLQSGDEFVLTGGKLEIFRRGERLGEWIVDERREQIEASREQSVADAQQECRENCEKLAQEITGWMTVAKPEEAPQPEMSWTGNYTDAVPKIQKISKEELDRIFSDLTVALSLKNSPLPTSTLPSIAWVESRRNPGAESSKEARGLMGIRNIVVEDMAKRPHIYAWLFQRIPDSVIGKIEPAEDARLLHEIKQSICRLPKKRLPSEAEIADCADGILKLRESIKNPVINCVLGGCYYTSILTDVKLPPPEMFEQIFAEINRGIINRYRRNKGDTPLKKGELPAFFDRIRQDVNLQRHFIALSLYNAGPNGEPEPGEHPYVYATLVMLYETHPQKEKETKTA